MGGMEVIHHEIERSRTRGHFIFTHENQMGAATHFQNRNLRPLE